MDIGDASGLSGRSTSQGRSNIGYRSSQASGGLRSGRGGEQWQRKKKLKATPPQGAPGPVALSAEQQAFAAEEDLQRKAVAKRRRYMARRGL